MAHASFSPCPHCNAPLVYLEGAAGSSMSPKCPRCRAEVRVSRATFLMADHSRPTAKAPRGLKPTS
jgi:phage FluMu protein Com